MDASSVLALRIFAGVVIVAGLIGGSVFWLTQRADYNKKRGVENRALIVRDREALQETQQRQSRILTCLSVAKDPQSCLAQVRGATGPGGQQGRRGVPGERGLSVVGARGPRGRDGEDGRSVRGPRGRPGKDGKDGVDGRDGVDGVDGLDAPTAAPVPPPEGTPVAPLIPCGLQPVEAGYRCDDEPQADAAPVP
jgi:hypothetical protein